MIEEGDVSADGTLLVGLGARLYRCGQGRLYVEDQSASGLHAWRKGFEKVIAYGICKHKEPPPGWSEAADACPPSQQFEFVELPDTYRLKSALRSWPMAKQQLREAIGRADFLVFSYGGWLGDPGELAASVARRMKRKHCVWLDRVESQVISASAGSKSERAKAAIKSWIVARHEKHALRKADLGLLHGKTVFEHFKAIAANPQIAEDIHLLDSDRIPSGELSSKVSGCETGPLEIGYVGRVTEMKGWRSWIEVIDNLAKRDIDFRAVWLGDGEDFGELVATSERLGLSDSQVAFPGFTADRAEVLQALRKSHILLFCHMTDESPRNLVESLLSATPLVGFEDPYSAELVNEGGAGVLVQRGDNAALTEAVVQLANDRLRLKDLILAAGRSAHHRTRERVFAERIALVRRHLSP